MTDKTLKILLGIIVVNLTIQTVKDVGLFPTAYAQSIQKVAICDDIYTSNININKSVMLHQIKNK